MAQDLIDFVVKALVDNPDAVSSQIIEKDGAKMVELKVKHDDVGKVIGKHGRIIHALRTILNASSHGDERYLLEVVDGE